ncbi:unnamed protein product [Calypogeia fissa]
MADKSGRKSVGNRPSRTTTVEELVSLAKSTHGFFPWRWQLAQSLVLETKKKQFVNEYLAQYALKLRTGGPPPPGVVADLLRAIKALQLPYLELDNWHMLKHIQFRVCFTGHLQSVLGDSEQQHFCDFMESHLSQLEDDGRIRDSTGPRQKKRKQADRTPDVASLRLIVAACKDGGWDQNGTDLMSEAVTYMTAAEKYFWF